MAYCSSDHSNPAYYRFWDGDMSYADKRPKFGIVLNGGGEYEFGFTEFMKRCDHGNIVIINAAETNEDGSYIESSWLYDGVIMEKYRPHSIEHFGIRTKAAAYDAYLIGRVSMADGIVFGSGDQFKYVQRWKNTPLEQAINNHVAIGKPIYGTSAGVAIASEFVYTGENDSISSSQAFRDPYYNPTYKYIEGNFHAFTPLKGYICDTHFAKRDRLGRLLSFIARIVENDSRREIDTFDGQDWHNTFGLGVDEDGAVIINQDGSATMEGNGAFIIVPKEKKDLNCRPNEDLIASTFNYYKLVPGKNFNVIKRRGTYKFKKEIEVYKGVIYYKSVGKWKEMTKRY